MLRGQGVNGRSCEIGVGDVRIEQRVTAGAPIKHRYAVGWGLPVGGVKDAGLTATPRSPSGMLRILAIGRSTRSG